MGKVGGKLKASGNERGSSSTRLYIRGKQRYLQIDPADGYPDKRVKYGEVDVLLWLNSTRTGVRKAYHKDCYIPVSVFYKQNEFLIRTIQLDGFILVAYKDKKDNLIGIRAPKQRADKMKILISTLLLAIVVFLQFNELNASGSEKASSSTRLCIRGKPKFVEIEGFRLVAYKSKRNELLGIRAPKQRGQNFVLEPTPSEWYINYYATHFTLTVNQTSEMVTGIHLKPKNLNVKAQIPPEHVEVARISFWVYRGPNLQIVGAGLA
ncbi:uncharacterized protein LOC117170038 [Belonocnema kinseyi]|uniref:uncharacterized protein LOC117170038 n=1 Tax=Belonocnema kinseyi TaxID=2817044 RepID=UPI00143D155E|nr:uncharacterized protein LOC117170038 [Belonocnema kinseyi]